MLVGDAEISTAWSATKMCADKDMRPRAFDLFPEVDTGGHEVPKGWNEAVQACYNAAGYRAALNMAHALSFALGAEWIWKQADSEH